MHHHTSFKATLLASLTAMAWAPSTGWADLLDLAQSPPATVPPYVAPNVILSLDDSGSMRWNLTSRATDPTRPAAKDYEEPNADGRWPADASRVSVLRNALRTVFNDKQLLPDGKIRLAWQVMNGSPAALAGNNAMRILDSVHRTHFLNFVKAFTAGNATPTHALMQRADAYMRQPLSAYSAWASIPGQQGAPYLGCRRNYHILMTDGGWNKQIIANQIPVPSYRNFDGRTRTLPDGRKYDTSAPDTGIYRDNDGGGNFSTIADWSFRSWADPLQPAQDLEGALRLPADYLNAQPSETFTNRVSGRQFTVTDKYWNPRFNPATWPHMATFTIGFSNDALPSFNYTQNGPKQRDNLLTPSSTAPYGYDGDFAEYASGIYVWRAAGGITEEGTLPKAHEADRGHDMWHAALNGRGKFYAVNQAQDLVAAFRQIVQQINTKAEPDRGSAATSGTTITRSAVGLYTAHYDPQRAWAGWITGQSVAMTQDGKGNDVTSAITGWQGKSTAQRLDDLSDAQVQDLRTVLGWNDDDGRGVPFQWSRIGTTQQARLNRQSDGTADTLGAHRLGYLRGVRSMEGTATPPSYPTSRPFRQRQSRQGDIVNSAIWYTGAPSALFSTREYRDFAKARKDRMPMLYVGGNDGMLHGFSATDGTEKIAYIPRGVMPGLPALTEPAYNDRHRYFVDGSPMTGDVLDGTQWKTLLVGTLGAGGKGYFVLDATAPGNFREANANALVLLDRSMHATETRPADCSVLPNAQSRDRCEADKDIGHVFAVPVLDDFDPQRSSQITRLNNDRWAVVLGNGYNSQSGRAVLLVQHLDGNRELLRLSAPAGAPGNGLSAPRLVDINGDGRPDVAYAGDLQGNLWKFLIASEDAGQWGVAFGGLPLLRTADAFDEPRSITAPPTVRANDRRKAVKSASGQDETLAVGGMMVAFGTGRNVAARDPDDGKSGAIYSVLDNTRYKLVEGGRVQPCLSTSEAACKLRADQVPRPVAASELVDLAQGKDTVAGAGASAGRTFWTVSGADLDWTRHKGWRFKLPEQGERLLKPMAFFDDSNILAIHSQIPARASDGTSMVETCEAGSADDERQFLTLLNIMDGKRPSVQIMDANGDGLYNAADQGVHRMTTSRGAQSRFVQGDRILFKGGQDEPQDKLARMPEQPVRPSWRQLR